MYLNKALACYVVIDGLRKIYKYINVEQKSVQPLFADSLLISYISLLVKSYPIQYDAFEVQCSCSDLKSTQNQVVIHFLISD